MGCGLERAPSAGRNSVFIRTTDLTHMLNWKREDFQYNWNDRNFRSKYGQTDCCHDGGFDKFAFYRIWNFIEFVIAFRCRTRPFQFDVPTIVRTSAFNHAHTRTQCVKVFSFGRTRCSCWRISIAFRSHRALSSEVSSNENWIQILWGRNASTPSVGTRMRFYEFFFLYITCIFFYL